MSGTTSSTVAPVMTASNAVGVSVNIYPYEGGSYTLSSANAALRSLSTAKALHQPFGTFQLELSPGGPSGKSAPTWTQILTTYSFVTIGMMRGGIAQIVMAGIITNVRELQQWSNEGAQRATIVQGADIGWFFSKNAWYSLAYLSGAPGALLGGAGLLSILSAGRVLDTPAQICQAFYTNIMAAPSGNPAAGTTAGVLAKTKFRIGGQAYAFSDVISTQFEEFNGPIAIPTGADFLSTGSPVWYDKFTSQLQPPWYEFFINTAPQGTYATTGGMALPGTASMFPNTEVSVVGRISPLPWLTNSGTPQNPSWSMNTTLWDALPRFTLGNAGFLQSSVGWDEEGVRNFYTITPTTIGNLIGASNGNISPFLATQALLTDEASVERYGYRPQITQTDWFYDTDGIYAKQLAANGQGAEDIAALYSDLLYRVASYWEPLPLMASGTVTIPCRPDILIGSQFEYVPFKDGVPWTFYIEAVSHAYRFGEGMSTQLVLTRGLPSSVYADTALLTAIHTGSASRVDGSYSMNEPPATPGLTAIGLQSVATGGIDAFSSPQGGVKPTS